MYFYRPSIESLSNTFQNYRHQNAFLFLRNEARTDASKIGKERGRNKCLENQRNAKRNSFIPEGNVEV